MRMTNSESSSLNMLLFSFINMHTVPISPGEHECITIAASSNDPYNCYVYGGTTLRWAAKMPFPPIHLSRVFNYKVRTFWIANYI